MKYLMQFRLLLAVCLMAVAAFAANMPVSQAAAAAGYTYTSQQYGYTIQCPAKPLGVIPLSVLSPSEQGEVLVFANDGYDIKKAWIVMQNAFDEKDLTNLDTISEADAKVLFAKVMASGYEYLSLVQIDGHNALYGMTSKVKYIDADNDGKPETKVEAENQQLKTFIRGKNQRYAVILLDNPELLKQDIKEYQAGVLTFREIDKKETKKK